MLKRPSLRSSKITPIYTIKTQGGSSEPPYYLIYTYIMKSLSNYIAESLNRGSLVYSLEDINSVLRDRKDIENE